mmetsp:Transcript_29034/g.92897  ORF Transcript_29034/g.92897 Transcript_29034/m.92897 type:complete len:557 (-) Transcript_29034:1373-3043(-)
MLVRTLIERLALRRENAIEIVRRDARLLVARLLKHREGVLDVLARDALDWPVVHVELEEIVERQRLHKLARACVLAVLHLVDGRLGLALARVEAQRPEEARDGRERHAARDLPLLRRLLAGGTELGVAKVVAHGLVLLTLAAALEHVDELVDAVAAAAARGVIERVRVDLEDVHGEVLAAGGEEHAGLALAAAAHDARADAPGMRDDAHHLLRVAVEGELQQAHDSLRRCVGDVLHRRQLRRRAIVGVVRWSAPLRHGQQVHQGATEGRAEARAAAALAVRIELLQLELRVGGEDAILEVVGERRVPRDARRDGRTGVLHRQRPALEHEPRAEAAVQHVVLHHLLVGADAHERLVAVLARAKDEARDGRAVALVPPNVDPRQRRRRRRRGRRDGRLVVVGVQCEGSRRRRPHAAGPRDGLEPEERHVVLGIGRGAHRAVAAKAHHVDRRGCVAEGGQVLERVGVHKLEDPAGEAHAEQRARQRSRRVRMRRQLRPHVEGARAQHRRRRRPDPRRHLLRRVVVVHDAAHVAQRLLRVVPELDSAVEHADGHAWVGRV